jgi:outer membrane protein OmpA-like peptidoglycan-associated protein
MTRITIPGAILILAAVSLAGCASKPAVAPATEAQGPAASVASAPAQAAAVEKAPAPEKPAISHATKAEPCSLELDVTSFWPAPESRTKGISFSVLIGNADLANSWKVDILPVAGQSSAAVRTFSGASGDRPESLKWEGQGPDGKVAPEGRYRARLSVEYRDGKLPAVSLLSKPFALSLSPPEPILSAEPARLEPAPGGVKKPLSFEIDAKPGLVDMEAWKLDLIGPDGRLFRSFKGTWPGAGAPEPLAWDGLSESGAAVQPGKRYAAVLSVRDVLGHAASAQTSVAVAELPYAGERSSVQPWTSGFSPNGDKVMDSMDFSLGFGQRAAIRSWRLEISHAEKGVQRSFRGSVPELPSSLSWDGKTDSGAAAPEGRYVAALNVDYGSTFSPAVARSSVFILDVTAPSLRLSYSPELFSPGPLGSEEGDSVLTINLAATSSLARVADWSLEIIDPGERVFARFGGAWPASGSPAPIAWNGVGSDGSLVESAEPYRLVARASDEFGNSSVQEGKVDTDILVIKDGDRYRVAVASIVFKGYTDDYTDLPPEQAKQNLRTLDRLALKFEKFPGYRIKLIGHAVMINWDDPNLGKPEQEKILVPLSRARAKAIAKALSDRGIEAKRMSIEGVGSNDPVVPDSDTVNRWKNRRVEFFLDK